FDEEDLEDPGDQIRMFTEDGSGDEDEDDDDTGNDHRDTVASNLIDVDEIELEDDDLNEMSDEGEDNRYTTESCKASLAKFRAIARKLNKSPNSKARFKELCQDHECPYCNARQQCESLVLLLAASMDLVEVLQPFYGITLQVSLCGAAWIADIVVFIDQITSHLSSAVSDKCDDYPLALRNACRAGLWLTNKYYTLTDCSPLYRVAMVLHPSFKDEYFKLAKWQPDGSKN
ncbi:hypothetical protein PSTG_17875, partial [Puccinia striiformis f. sp. tritici PST-78]